MSILMKKVMGAYILRFHNHKLFVVVLLVVSVFHLSGHQFTTNQEACKRDTLLYYWHNAANDSYPNQIPEDCYMELYFMDGILKKGFFWGTTDEFDRGREGYECGYFVLPMTEIRQDKDSVSFKLNPIRTKHGEYGSCFVKAPVDLHIRSWQEALSRYQRWDYISGGLFDKGIMYSIFLNKEFKKTFRHSPIGDSVSVRNLTNNSWKKRTFVLHNGNL